MSQAVRKGNHDFKTGVPVECPRSRSRNCLNLANPSSGALDARTISVPLGFTDSASTTCLHVPSIGLIVAGDAAYNGDHLHLSESPDQQKRQEWIAALDKMESLKPRAVIAGHKRVGNDDSPKILGETRKYIRDFERLAMQTMTAQELYDEMLKLYPDWINRGALWTSVRAIKT